MKISELTGIKRIQKKDGEEFEIDEYSQLEFAEIKLQTKKAVLFVFQEEPTEEWYPKSQLRKHNPGKELVIMVSNWWIEKMAEDNAD